MNANTKVEVFYQKVFNLVADDALKVVLNGTDQDTYTVPTGKTATIYIVFDGSEE